MIRARANGTLCLQSIDDPPVNDDDAMKQWLDNIRSNHRQLINVRDDRHRRRNDMTRRRTQASQQRMKIITELAQGGAACTECFVTDHEWYMLHVCIFVITLWGWLVVAYELIVLVSGRKSKKDDTFGMKDEDWNVYKAIVSHRYQPVKQFYSSTLIVSCIRSS